MSKAPTNNHLFPLEDSQLNTQKAYMFKVLAILSSALVISACTPEAPVPQAPKIEVEKNDRAVKVETPQAPQSTEQVKAIAKEYGVSESKVNDTASRAAELSGGNANKQDMLDALKAATGK